MKSETESLPCPISEERRAELSERLVRESMAVAVAKADEKLRVKQAKLAIAALEQAHDRTRQILATGEEDRMVLVVRRLSADRRSVETWRVDTGEVVGSRPAENADLQRSLEEGDDDGD